MAAKARYQNSHMDLCNNGQMERTVIGDVSNESSFGKHLENAPCLVLNADFTPMCLTPLSLWGWKDALRAVFSDKAVVVHTYENLKIRSVSVEWEAPSVIALKRYYAQPSTTPAFSRKGVFVRDGFTCAYCEERFDYRDLTLDHVIPRSRGGVTSWTNTVSACAHCNRKKGSFSVDELPQLGMRLLRKPKAPTHYELQKKARSSLQVRHPIWNSFI